MVAGSATGTGADVESRRPHGPRRGTGRLRPLAGAAIVTLLVLAGSLAAGSTPTSGAGPGPARGTPANDSPDNLSAMTGDAVVYDPSAGGLLVFGDLGVGPQNQTWLLTSGGWTNQTRGAGPSARLDAAIAYDPAISAVVMFGGTTPGGQALNDTWAYAGGNWTPWHPSRSPAASAYLGFQQMVYDPARSALVLVTAVLNGSALLAGDNLTTWVYEGGGWEPIDFQGVSDEFSSVYLGDPELAVDPVSGALILPNGFNESSFGYDVWEFDGGRWAPETGPALPGAGIVWADAPAPQGADLLALGEFWLSSPALALAWPTFLGNLTGWTNVTAIAGMPAGLVIPFGLVAVNGSSGDYDLLLGETLASTPATGPSLWRYTDGSWSEPSTRLAGGAAARPGSATSWAVGVVPVAAVALAVVAAVVFVRWRRRRPAGPPGRPVGPA